VPHLFEVGAQLPASTQLYWGSGDGTCHMYTWDPTQQRLYSAGAELPFDPYALLTRQTD